MNSNSDLEQFKENFTKGYIDKYLDRLLDLRNAIKKATSFDEVKVLMEREQSFLKSEFGEKPTKVPVREKDETEIQEKPNSSGEKT